MFRWIKDLWNRLSLGNVQKDVVEDALDPESPPESAEESKTSVVSEPVPEESQVEGCSVVEREGEMVKYGCGHHDTERFKLDLYGLEVFRKEETARRRELCGACSVKDAVQGVIRCARCGLAIPPNTRVLLCPSSLISDHKWNVPWSKNDVVMGAICCMRPNCCVPGSYLTAIWLGTDFELTNGYIEILSGTTASPPGLRN